MSREGIPGDTDPSMKAEYFVEFVAGEKSVLNRICGTQMQWEMGAKAGFLVMV